MYNDLKKTTIEITNFRFENDEFSKRKEKKRKGGGGGEGRGWDENRWKNIVISISVELSISRFETRDKINIKNVEIRWDDEIAITMISVGKISRKMEWKKKGSVYLSSVTRIDEEDP